MGIEHQTEQGSARARSANDKEHGHFGQFRLSGHRNILPSKSIKNQEDGRGLRFLIFDLAF
jgi:hypothetical protein